LAAKGYQFYSDELAVIDVGRVTVSPFPLPMGIKRDSTKALEPYYPGLPSAPFSLRSDGKRVHYLRPPDGSLPPARDEAEIGRLIFPRYAHQGETRLVSLEKQDALQRLVKTGSSDRELSPADMRALVRIVDESSCHALDYSQLGDALRVLARLDEGQ
jgi:hypothetical protein